MTVTGQDNTADDNIDVSLSAGTVTGIVGGSIGLTGVEALTVNANGTDTMDAIDVTGLGGTTSLSRVTVNGNANATDTLTIGGTSGNDALNYTPTGTTSGRFTADGVTTVLDYAGFGGILTADGAGGGADVLHVLGGAGVDSVGIPLTASVAS